MRRRREQADIQEPPLKEIKKKRSCFRRSCTTGCGCIVLFIIGVLLFLKFVVLTRPKTVKSVPQHFPDSVPLYDTERIDSITFLSGKQKGRVMGAVSYVTQRTLSPFSGIFDKDIGISDTISTVGFEDVVTFLSDPVTDPRDVVQIEWTELPAEPSFILNFYRTTLAQRGYTVAAGYASSDVYNLTFGNGTVDGALHIEDPSDDHGTSFMSLTLSLPHYGN